MTTDMITLAERLLSMGGQAGMLLLATYYLARVLKGQYEARISELERRSEQCEEHRLQLGQEIRAIQDNRIAILERLLEKNEV